MTLGQHSFEDLGAPLHEIPFCVLDLETTGGSPSNCAITEIGAVRFLGSKPTGTFHTLVNPGVPIPPMITLLTGITQSMVMVAPTIGEALPAFLEFVGDSVVVGHNVRFDMAFLNSAVERLGYGRLANRTVDTLRLARRLVRNEVRSLRLGTLAAHFRSPVAPTHRALDDARATAHVLWALLERAESLGVSHLDDLLRLPTARETTHYDKIRLTESLPCRPGVYFFRDREREIIYVGKAKNLRTRVRSYFYGDDRRLIAQMLRDLCSIEHRECATEIEAEIAELRLIHAHRPRYNRRSKPPKSPHWIKLTRERFPRLSMVRTYWDDECLYLGPFRSRRHASVVVTALWDAVPIRRCLTKQGKRSAACNFAQLGVAICPCDGSVTDEEYATVVDRLRTGVDEDPTLLLGVLESRMRDHARDRRFEEAALLRDRYRALANALQRRRAWTALQRAGTLWAVDDEGAHVVAESGRLVASWRDPEPPPLLPLDPAPGAPFPQVPAAVLVAEEAHLFGAGSIGPGYRSSTRHGRSGRPFNPVPVSKNSPADLPSEPVHSGITSLSRTGNATPEREQLRLSSCDSHPGGTGLNQRVHDGDVRQRPHAGQRQFFPAIQRLRSPQPRDPRVRGRCQGHRAR